MSTTMPPVKARDIAKMLRKLLQPTISLVSVADIGDCYDKSQKEWRLIRRTKGKQEELQDIPGHLALDLRSRDLIQSVDRGTWTISTVGRAWLKRYLSGSDPYQAQQMDIVKKAIDVDGVTRVASFDLSESPLMWLRQRRDKNGIALIDDAQFSAGERLRSDFTRAHMSPRVTTNWNAIPDAARKRGGSGSVEILDSVIESNQRFNRAIKAVGPELSEILIDVCCFLKGLEETEAKNKWPRRSAKLILQIALTRLARYYGFGPSQRKAARKGAIHHWGTDDFRPEIDGEP